MHLLSGQGGGGTNSRSILAVNQPDVVQRVFFRFDVQFGPVLAQVANKVALPPRHLQQKNSTFTFFTALQLIIHFSPVLDPIF